MRDLCATCRERIYDSLEVRRFEEIDDAILRDRTIVVLYFGGPEPWRCGY